MTQVGVAHAMNQDRLVDRPEIGLWAVADGAGGHEHGDIASSMLADALAELPPGLTGADMVAAVRSRVAAIHQLLRTRAELRSAETGAPVTIASTIVLMLASDSYYACLWAGDSRAYRLHEGALTRLTHDHSLVQALVDEGALTEAEAEKHPLSNVITRAIGADVSELTLDKVTDRAAHGDRFLLCSDGLTKTVEEAGIADLVAGDNPAESLLAAALERNARDDVTVVVIEFTGEPEETG